MSISTSLEKRSAAEITAIAQEAYAEYSDHTRALTLELAQTVASSEAPPTIKDALHAILGFNGRGYEEHYEKAKHTLWTVAKGPLAKLVIFDKDNMLETVGVLADPSLDLEFDLTETFLSGHKRRLEARACLSMGKTRRDGLLRSPGHMWSLPEHMLQPKILIINSEQYSTGYVDMPVVQTFEGVSQGFNLLQSDDTRGHEIMGIFFDTLLAGADETLN